MMECGIFVKNGFEAIQPAEGPKKKVQKSEKYFWTFHAARARHIYLRIFRIFSFLALIFTFFTFFIALFLDGVAHRSELG